MAGRPRPVPRRPYLTTRDHARVYTVDDADWVAMQVHRKYWDWFRLRHTVTDVTDSRDQLVADLSERSYRTRGSFQIDAEGPSFISLERAGLLLVALALPAAGRRMSDRSLPSSVPPDTRRAVLLGAFVLTTVPAIRVLGVAGELAIGGLSPKFVAAPLYLVLAIGLPLGTVRLARAVRPRMAFTTVAVALPAGVILDFLVLGLLVPPLSIVVDRLILAAGLGLLAVSATPGRWQRSLAAGGLLTWTLGLLVALELVPA